MQQLPVARTDGIVLGLDNVDHPAPAILLDQVDQAAGDERESSTSRTGTFCPAPSRHGRSAGDLLHATAVRRSGTAAQVLAPPFASSFAAFTAPIRSDGVVGEPALFCMPSFSRMRLRYVLTVLTERNSCSAICETVMPLASRHRTWNSRSDSSRCRGWSVSASSRRASSSGNRLAHVPTSLQGDAHRSKDFVRVRVLRT